ncbi:MAG: fumarylacetoacetate hydrolase family protein [Syntrophomonas sp.]|nr:fumarylacetoacetate hydrolase family protein [Syntrophomonas sp.]
MKFVSFYYGGEENVGILIDDYVMPINEITLLNNKKISSMLELIETMNKELMHQLDKAVTDLQYRRIPLNSIKLLAPIPNPKRNIFCLGKNYAEHAREIEATKISDTGIPEYPVYFTKTANPAIADGDNIVFSDAVTGQVDYEAELAIIIGKKGTNIKPEEAEDHIFGYTIINDISARDLQVKHKQWFKAKSLDTFCPMGPVIADKREIPFPVDLKIQSRINGELRQDSKTGKMIFSIPHIVSDLSQGLTLIPGDIISTGTPSGVGMGYKPPRFLTEGDIVECYVEKIGKLTNRVGIV